MTNEEPTAEETPPKTQEGLYLTFVLAEEMYGVEILAVQEIIQMAPITVVPRTPDAVRGVINLRGKVIPVIDLRRKFGMEPAADSSQTCTVVVQVRSNGQSITLGVVVDQVAEVLNVAGDQVEAPPNFGTAVSTDFIQGMGKVDKKVVMLLDVDKVLASDELAAVSQMAEN